MNRPNLKTKERILQSAIQEFIESGYHGARMQKIADKAGVNKAMLFYYYSTKEDIYEEALNSVLKDVMDKLNNIPAEAASLEEMIRQIIRAYAGVFGEHPDQMKLFLNELNSGGAHLKKLDSFKPELFPFNPNTGKIYQYFKSKVEAGEIRDINIFQLITSIIGQIMAVYIIRPLLEAFSSNFGFAMDKFYAEREDFVVKLVLEGIRKH